MTVLRRGATVNHGRLNSMCALSQPSMLVIEAARVYDAEAAALVGVFARYGYRWKVHSNDPAWPEPAWPTRASISLSIERFDPTFVHFALHGVEQGLVLRARERLGSRDEDILAWSDIEEMSVWKEKIVVTGACGALPYASSFLNAGALAVVAPNLPINWGNLCHFFRIFYSNLLDGNSIGEALSATKLYARVHYRKYDSMGVEGDQHWRLKGGGEDTAQPGACTRTAGSASRR